MDRAGAPARPVPPATPPALPDTLYDLIDFFEKPLPPDLPRDAWVDLARVDAYLAFHHLPATLRADCRLLRQMVCANPRVYAAIPVATKRERPDLLFCALEQWTSACMSAPSCLTSDLHVMRTAVAIQPWAFAAASEELRSDPAFARTALARQGRLLLHAGEVLRNSPEMLAVALTTYPLAWQFRDEPEASFEGKQQLALATVVRDGFALQYMGASLQDEEVIVEHAVRNQGLAFAYASPRLQAVERIARAAIRSDSAAFMWASDALRATPEIVLFAVRQTPRGLPFREVRRRRSPICYATVSIRRDEAVVRAAVEWEATAIFHAAPTAAADPHVIEALLQYVANLGKRNDSGVVLALAREDDIASAEIELPTPSHFLQALRIKDRGPHVLRALVAVLYRGALPDEPNPVLDMYRSFLLRVLRLAHAHQMGTMLVRKVSRRRLFGAINSKAYEESAVREAVSETILPLPIGRPFSASASPAASCGMREVEDAYDAIVLVHSECSRFTDDPARSPQIFWR